MSSCWGDNASDGSVEVEHWRGSAVDCRGPPLRPGIGVGEEPGAGRFVGDLDIGTQESCDHC